MGTGLSQLGTVRKIRKGVSINDSSTSEARIDSARHNSHLFRWPQSENKYPDTTNNSATLANGSN